METQPRSNAHGVQAPSRHESVQRARRNAEVPRCCSDRQQRLKRHRRLDVHCLVLSHGDIVSPEPRSLHSASETKPDQLSVEEAVQAGFQLGVLSEQSRVRRLEREREFAKRRSPEERRSNDAHNWHKLLWVALLLREAERRGESPRTFVEDRMIFVKADGKMSASHATIGRKITEARHLLEHDFRFQNEVDCYRFKDA